MNVETIKAIASLWPLALILLLTATLVAVLVFFRTECRAFLTNLKNLQFRRGKTQISLNQNLGTAPVDTSEKRSKTNTAVAPPKLDEEKASPAKNESQPELD